MNQQQKGFTLIELMITVAIIAILAAIAYPSYQQHVIRTWRGSATACLTQLAQGMERRYTTTSPMSYAGAIVTDGCTTENDMNTRYAFSRADNTSAQSFTLSATPTAAQNDPQCGTLTLNERGVRGESGTGTVADCW